jgi:uncharacterized membrane protein YfcA
MKLLLVSLGIGITAGVLAALCGVGGGVIMVPAFVMLLGLDQKHALATSMAVIVPTAIAATAQHVKNGLIDWRIAIATAIAATLTSYFVADTVKKFKNEDLTRIFAVVIILFGVMMLVKPPAKATPTLEPAEPVIESVPESR